MRDQNPIKVVKRVERERLLRQAAASESSGTSAHAKARELAATVNEWISEFRQTRPAWTQELKRQLGWPETEGNGTLSGPCEGEK